MLVVRMAGGRMAEVWEHHRDLYAADEFRGLRDWPDARTGPRQRAGTPSDGRAQPALTFGRISSLRRFMSSRVFATGTSANGGQISGMVSPASL